MGFALDDLVADLIVGAVFRKHTKAEAGGVEVDDGVCDGLFVDETFLDRLGEGMISGTAV